jgi:hypothetical protein
MRILPPALDGGLNTLYLVYKYLPRFTNVYSGTNNHIQVERRKLIRGTAAKNGSVLPYGSAWVMKLTI